MFSLECSRNRHNSVGEDKFYSYHSLRPMHARAVRPSGGICILVNKSLRKRRNTILTKVVKVTELTVWIQISGSILNTQRDLFLCGVYIPPSNSTFYKKTQCYLWRSGQTICMSWERNHWIYRERGHYYLGRSQLTNWP